jgi:hypothetical protein
MRLKSVIAFAACMAALASVSVAQADTYKPGDYLLLDLKKAVLSPQLLGPPASFEHVQIEARSDTKNAIDAAADAPQVRASKAVAAKPQRSAAIRPQPATRNPVARKRTNPLDANAADTRVQVWPCRSGGICNWQKK